MITRYLSKPDYALERAFTKNDVIAMARSMKPDLILLNLTMNIAACASALGGQERRDAYVAKPVHDQELYEAINLLMPANK